MHPGDRIAERFELSRVAGAGAMATVFEALDEQTGERVALKVVRNLGPQYQQRFARECVILSSLRHAGIVRYVAHGTTTRGDMYLAMEWLEGLDLSKRLARAPMSIAASLALARRTAQALAVAHDRGVVHRDIKPSNLLLLDETGDRVKVLDFGVARVLRATQLTQTGTRIGTVRYMAPEQARGDRGVDARCDIWALGCVLYECLAGRPAFPGENDVAILAKLVLEEPPPLRALDADIPRDLDRLVARMLAKDPSERPGSAQIVAEALEQLIAATPVPAPDTVTDPSGEALTSDEIRLLSVVLAGPEGSNDPGSTAPLADFPRRKRRALRPAIDHLGGRMEALGDGGLVVTLSGAGSATELAARAARCAIAVRRVAPRSPVAVAVGLGQLEGRSPVGAVIDSAASVLSGAESAAVHLDDTAARLLDPQFEVRHSEAGHQLVRERDNLDVSRTLLGRRTEFVGRRKEIVTLEATFAECFEDSVARAAVVVGPAGMGKSRLRFELVRRLGDAASVWMARGDSMRAGSPFAMLSEALLREAQVQAGAPLAASRGRLLSRISRHIDEPDASRIAAFLGEVAGVRAQSDDVELAAARQDPQLMGDQIRRAWQDLLDAETAQGPLVLILEDLHWGDRSTVELLDLALRNLCDRPLMVLALARPGVRELFPDLWAARDAQEIRLSPLTKKACAAFVRAALSDIDDGTIAAVTAKAQGNPFYLEEMVRAVASGTDIELPDTLVAITQSGLERLESDSRQILRAASVFGQTFWAGGVATLVGHMAAVDDWLGVLEDAEMISRNVHSRLAEHTEYRFRHDLIRGAAYSMLTQSDRELGHRLAAEWLEDAGERDPMVLAEHFEAAAMPARAAAWYRRAAELAIESNDVDEALSRAARGIACGAKGPDRTGLLAVKVDAHTWRGENEDTVATSEELLDSLDPGSDRWCRVAAARAIAKVRLGDTSALIELGQDMLELLQDAEPTGAQAIAASRAAVSLLYRRHELADPLYELIEPARGRFDDQPLVAGRLHNAAAQRAYFEGDLASALDAFFAVANSYERAGNQRLAAMHRGNIAAAYLALGDYESAESNVRSSLEQFERMGLSRVAWGNKLNLGIALALGGNALEGERLALAAADGFREQSNMRMAGAARVWAARTRLMSGDAEAAAADARRAESELSTAPSMQAFAIAVRAAALLGLGRSDDALEVAQRAMAMVEGLGGLEEGEAFTRLIHARALAAAARPSEAEVAIAEARDALVARAAKISRESLRQQFLRAVEENAETLDMAEAFGV